MTSERARLFVALELPDPVRDALLAWRQSALGDERAWRPVAPAALHLTLCFLGDQGVEEIAAIARACAAGLSERSVPGRDVPEREVPGRDVAKREVPEREVPERRVPALAAPVLTLAAPVLLGPRRARVLAVALEDPEKALTVIQRRLAQWLAAGGWYQPESRPYLAHVTVARARRGTPVPAAPAYPAPPALEFKPTTISLLRSHLGAHGARYERLATVELAPIARP